MTAAAAYGYTAVGVIVAGFGVYAGCVLAGHERLACLRRTVAFRATRAALRALIAARSAVIRARWAWACRKPPARTEGKLNRADHLTFISLVETWRQSGAPERTRT